MVQAAEHAVADTLAIVFPSGGIISLPSLDAAEEMKQRRTLDGLLAELRQRSENRRDCEDIPTESLSSRNEFIHRFTRTFELASPAGRAAGFEPCKKLGG
jgi:hypothetical protein